MDTRFRRILLAFLVVMLAAVTTASARHRSRVYRVTITNLTKNQPISPPVLATHRSSVAIFQAGDAAIPELVKVAEDGVNGDLATLLESLDEVSDVEAAAMPIGPGGSMEFEIAASRHFNRLSIVGMLVNTNDAFFGVSSVELPSRKWATVSWNAPAYDAGSEGNNEDCDFIPGPACGGGMMRDTAGAEGFVHIHNGVHGIADLDPSAYDWHNPVVRVTVRRVR